MTRAGGRSQKRTSNITTKEMDVVVYDASGLRISVEGEEMNTILRDSVDTRNKTDWRSSANVSLRQNMSQVGLLVIYLLAVEIEFQKLYTCLHSL